MKLRMHYAWVNAALCALVLFASGTVSQTYGIFLPEIAAELGCGMSQVSAAVTILNAVMAVCGAIAARGVERFGMRRALPASLAVLSGLLVCLAAAQSLSGVYLCYALCGCCLYLGMFYLCPYIVNKWFRARVAETIALIITAMAVGGAAGNLVLSAVIRRWSWRAAYRWEAGFLLCVALLELMLLRDSPDQLGLQPYARQAGGAPPQTDRMGGAALTLARAVRRPAFYCVVLYVACMQFCVGMQSQIPTIAASAGLAAAIGAAAASVNSLGGIPAKALLSFLNVRIGVVGSVVLYNLVGITGIVGFLLLKNTTGLLLFALLFGFCIGSTTVQLPLLSNRLFGASGDYGRIHARIVLISGLLATPSALVGGRIYDLTGEYDLALCLLAALLLAAMLFAVKAWKSK